MNEEKQKKNRGKRHKTCEINNKYNEWMQKNEKLENVSLTYKTIFV